MSKLNHNPLGIGKNAALPYKNRNLKGKDEALEQIKKELPSEKDNLNKSKEENKNGEN